MALLPSFILNCPFVINIPSSSYTQMCFQSLVVRPYHIAKCGVLVTSITFATSVINSYILIKVFLQIGFIRTLGLTTFRQFSFQPLFFIPSLLSLKCDVSDTSYIWVSSGFLMGISYLKIQTTSWFDYCGPHKNTLPCHLPKCRLMRK